MYASNSSEVFTPNTSATNTYSGYGYVRFGGIAVQMIEASSSAGENTLLDLSKNASLAKNKGKIIYVSGSITGSSNTGNYTTPEIKDASETFDIPNKFYFNENGVWYPSTFFSFEEEAEETVVENVFGVHRRRLLVVFESGTGFFGTISDEDLSSFSNSWGNGTSNLTFENATEFFGTMGDSDLSSFSATFSENAATEITLN